MTLTEQVANVAIDMGGAKVADLRSRFPGKSAQHLRQAAERAVWDKRLLRTEVDGAVIYGPTKEQENARYPSVWAYAQGETA
jgi:hypothetical protein